MKTRGFSLIEMMVAVAIAGIIAASAVMVTGQIIRNIREAENLVRSYDRAKTLIDYMVTFLQPVGGGGLRPWAAIEVVDNLDGAPPFTRPGDIKPGTDMLRIIEQDPNLDECGLISRVGTQYISDNASCCLTAAHGNRISTISSGDGLNWDVFTTGGVDTTNCKILYDPTSSIAASQATPLNGSVFINGTITPARKRIFYLNTADELHMLFDENGDGSADDFLVAPGVADLQFSKGYDVNGDGTLSEDGTENDEWSNNDKDGSFTGDDDRGEAGTGLEDADQEDLRMVLIGITVKARQRGRTDTNRLLNGPPVTEPGFRLRSTTGRAYLRNLNIFQ